MAYEKRNDGKICPVDDIASQAFTVNKRTLAHRMTEMYVLLGTVIEGSTIDFLTKVLKGVMYCSCIALGWYIGVLWGKYKTGDYFKSNCTVAGS